MSQQPRSVLVVDDDALVREALYDVLDIAGYEVSTAANAYEALQQVQLQAPSAAICDVRMPVVGGLELVAALKAAPTTRDTPVILLSGLGSEEDIARGLEAGASVYLTKPVNVRKLLALLSSVAA